MSLFLGLDTSAYTTSLAVVDAAGAILFDERIMLEVEKGERGLRQSEALFQHLKNLSPIFSRLPHSLYNKIDAIAASAFPRNTEGSYMPVFLAGLNQGRVLSAFTGLDLFEVSHQEGHIMAGLYGHDSTLGRRPFLAVHFSGGTPEILQVKPGSTRPVRSCPPWRTSCLL